MKKFIVDTEEKNRILKMHKSLVAEQNTPIGPPQETPIAVKILDGFMNAGCIARNKIFQFKNTETFYVKQKDTEGTVIRWYPDKSFEVLDKQGKVLDKGSFTCEKYDTEVKLLRDKDWKRRDELKDIPMSQLSNPNQWARKDVFGVPFYKHVRDTKSPETYDDKQEEILKYFQDQGWEPEGNFAVGVGTKCKSMYELNPDYASLFKSDFRMCKDFKSVDKDKSNLPDEKEDLKLPKKFCRQHIDYFYDSFLSTDYDQITKQSDISDSTLLNSKEIVTRCIRQASGTGGGLFGMGNTDNKVRALTQTQRDNEERKKWYGPKSKKDFYYINPGNRIIR